MDSAIPKVAGTLQGEAEVDSELILHLWQYSGSKLGKKPGSSAIWATNRCQTGEAPKLLVATRISKDLTELKPSSGDGTNQLH